MRPSNHWEPIYFPITFPQRGTLRSRASTLTPPNTFSAHPCTIFPRLSGVSSTEWERASKHCAPKLLEPVTIALSALYLHKRLFWRRLRIFRWGSCGTTWNAFYLLWVRKLRRTSPASDIILPHHLPDTAGLKLLFLQDGEVTSSLTHIIEENTGLSFTLLSLKRLYMCDHYCN